jgi:hypothetical protein
MQHAPSSMIVGYKAKQDNVNDIPIPNARSRPQGTLTNGCFGTVVFAVFKQD